MLYKGIIYSKLKQIIKESKGQTCFSLDITLFLQSIVLFHKPYAQTSIEEMRIIAAPMFSLHRRVYSKCYEKAHYIREAEYHPKKTE
jgi:hypothetical protein